MHFLKILVLLAVAFTFGCGGSGDGRGESRTPNFVVIFVDDMGYGDIGPYGSTLNRTPNLDRMAAEGMKLTSFYAAPVCTPSRASLITGSYPPRVGLTMGSWHTVLHPGDPNGIHDDEVTIAEVLKTKDYATACIGKWHLGDQPQFLPTRHGFDYYYGLPYSNDMTPHHYGGNFRNFPPLPLVRNETAIQAVDDQSFLTGSYTDEAVRFMEENRDRPFFVYLPHTMVHVPLYAGEEFRGKSGNGILGDAIEEIDHGVGRILDTIGRLGLAENTLVIFTSDNGPARGSAGPLRGRKGTTFEGGMREPTLAWWPGTVAGGSSSDEITSTMDLLPTFAALAGAKLPGHKIDGGDISGILRGAAGAKTPYEAFYYYREFDLRAVRSGPWKYHDTGELYNLDEEIGEETNVAAAHPEIVEKMEAYLTAMRNDLGDGEEFPCKNCRPHGLVESPKFLIPRPETAELGPHDPLDKGPVNIDPKLERPDNW